MASLAAAAMLATAAPTAVAAEAAAEIETSEASRPTTAGPYAVDRVVVKFGTPAARRATVAALGRGVRAVATTGQGAGVTVLRVDAGERDEVLADLRSSPAVAYAELDAVVEAFRTPNDEFWSRQWASRRVHAPRAWDLETGARDTVVAVLDTGVLRGHPDLDGALLAGHDFVNGDRHPHDDDIEGHGTQVTGVVAARGDNARGVAGYCWRCRVLPVKVLDELGGGFASDVARGIRYAVDHGADVINMSFGGQVRSRILRDAVAYARRKDVLLVAAAGNSNSQRRTYPAAYPGVVAVAGSNQRDGRYRHPSARIGSNHGGWVDIAAPWYNATTGPDNGYYRFGGTSAAAPVVSGIAALLRSLDPRTTAGDVRTMLFRTARRADNLGYVTHGRVEADRPLVWRLRGVPLVGDWNGDGADTPGWFKRGRFYLSNRHSQSRSFRVVSFGRLGDRPVVGDWDGDGIDTIGVRRDDQWFLRNSNSNGPADHKFRFGRAQDTPVVGDWNGDGADTVGFRRGRVWRLRNDLKGEATGHVFEFGHTNDVPVTGDWDRDGKDGVGLRRGDQWLLRNSVSSGRPDRILRYGGRRAVPATGDFDGDGRDTVGVVSGSLWQLRNVNTEGKAHGRFRYGG